MDEEPKETSSSFHATPWLVAIIVGSLVPLFLVKVDGIFPGLLWESEEFYPFPGGLLVPLHGASLVLVVSAMTAFWLIGLTLSIRPAIASSSKTELVGGVLLLLAIGELFLVVPLLSAMWTLAVTNGYINFEAWGTYEGNHGPWRHIYNLRKILNFAFLLPAYSLALALVSLVIKMRKEGFYVVFGSIVAFFALISTHYWLID